MKHPLARFLARRLLAGLLFVVLVSSGAFVLGRLAPGDAVVPLELAGADAAAAAAARARLGLDRSLPAQLGSWFAGLAEFDFGRSSRYNRPVAELLASSVRRTAELAAVALILATAIGLPIGVYAGAHPRGWFARAISLVSSALLSCPPMVAALALLLLAVRTGWPWLSVSPGSLAVPALALALPLAAGLERLQARATADALAGADVAAAAARGVPPARLVWVHALRQSLTPVLGIYGLVIGSLFSGSLAVEVVTSWPGLGRLTYDALVSRDLHLLAGSALAGATLIALGNLIADLLRAAADPRVRES